MLVEGQTSVYSGGLLLQLSEQQDTFLQKLVNLLVV